MKLLPVTLLLCLALQSPAQTDPRMDDIAAYVKLIDTQRLRAQDFAWDGLYSEPDAQPLVNIGDLKLTAHYTEKGHELVKIAAAYTGSYGDLTTYIYFRNNEPVLVRKVLMVYDPPKFIEGSKHTQTVMDEYYLTTEKILAYKTDYGPIIQNSHSGVLNLTEKYTELQKDLKYYLSRLGQ